MTAPRAATPLGDVLTRGDVTSVYQPIVDLDTGALVAYEALARGPEGVLRSPAELFAAARAEGRLAELDELCRRAALRGAVEQGLLAPLTLFVNVEPEVLETAPLEDLLAIASAAPGELAVVLEITERALATRPADLLRAVQRVRDLGWGVALDDVGADTLSLAFMPLLRPDVVKLDLRLVQERPSSAVSEIMNAVNAYAEGTGAVVLAEGIEDERHLAVARALGARLGQGWLLGRPAARPASERPVRRLELLPPAARTATVASPFAVLPPDVPLRRSPKGLLIELSKQLERAALRHGDTCVIASTFQEARHFTPATAARYRDLASRTGFVCALGEDLPLEPVPGVRGAALHSDDPVRDEWDVTVVAPHFAAALLARDLGDDGPERDRTFEYALTYRRDLVVAATNALLARVAPRAPALTVMRADRGAQPPAPAARVPAPTALLHRALATMTSGVCIVAMTEPDEPLVYVNDAFLRLAGAGAQDVLGRNCRFLQGPDTDPGALARLRAALDSGAEYRETLLNYRGPDRTPWWNEVSLSPVLDPDGAVVQYIGIQNDVTARVQTQRDLVRERDRAQTYLSQIESLSYVDPLTGLANRRRVEQALEVELWEARGRGTALAVVFLDLDGFKEVNDLLGHAAGDELLVTLAQRLRGAVRRRDLLGRHGGDEFVLALPDLEPQTAAERSRAVVEQLRDVVRRPVRLHGTEVRVDLSAGIALAPRDAEDVRGLVHLADARMYEAKPRGSRRPRMAAVEADPAPAATAPADRAPQLRERPRR